MKKILFWALGLGVSMGLSAGSNTFVSHYNGIIQVRVRFHAETKIGCRPTKVATITRGPGIKLGGPCIVKEFEWRRGKKGRWATVKSKNGKAWIFPENEAWGPVERPKSSSSAKSDRAARTSLDALGALRGPRLF